MRTKAAYRVSLILAFFLCQQVFKLIDEGNEVTNDADAGDFEEITESKATTIEEWCQINSDKFM